MPKLYPSQLGEFYLKYFSQKCFKVDAYAPEGKEKRQKASQWRHEPAPWKLALEENLIQFNSNAAANRIEYSISRSRPGSYCARHLRPFRMMRVFSLRKD